MLLFITLFTFSACSNKQPEGPAAPQLKAYKVGTEPLEPRLIEQDAYNIPYWLANKASGRVLVRISPMDGLGPVKDDALEKIRSFQKSGDMNGIISVSDSRRPDALVRHFNTAWLAHTLGVADEVYVVAPLFESLTVDDLDGIKSSLTEEYPDQQKDIEGLTLTGAVAEGTINGVPVKISCLQDLPRTDKPVLLEIDLSFFETLYKNEKNTPILGIIKGFFKTLKEAGVVSDQVTIAMSNEDGLAPLKFRFMGRYLAQLLKEPGLIDSSDPPALWSERAAAWKTEQMSPRESVAIYKNIAKKFPGDAASRYDLSEVYFGLGDLDGAKQELAEAIKLDPGYGSACQAYADTLKKKGKEKDAEGFMALLK